ncbi:MAG: Lrp/AsnC ligand binding domain-containing protein [Bacteroidales bacterium]
MITYKKKNDEFPQIDDLDRKILRIITKNARTPFLEVARDCGVSGAAIHQRVQRLVALGVVSGSEFILDPEKLGYNSCSYMGLILEKGKHLDAVYKRLLDIPEVVECHFMTGQYSMYIKILAQNNAHLKHIIDMIGEIDEVSRTETSISLQKAFQRQIPV